MEIEFDHIPENLYIGNINTNSKFPVCGFSKTAKHGYKPFPNEPSTGFTFATGSHEGAMIIDPRGFCFNISYSNLVQLLLKSTVVDGEIIGEYRWIWKNNQFIIEKESIVKTMDIIPEVDIMANVEFNGDLCKQYKLPSGEYGTYIGRCFSLVQYHWKQTLHSGDPKCVIGSEVRELFLKNAMMNRHTSVSSTAEHVFVIFNKGQIKYKSYKKFVSYGDKGYSEVITKDNIKDYYRTLMLTGYSAIFCQYFSYDMSKFYYNTGRRTKEVQVELSHAEINELIDIDPNIPIFAFDRSGKYYGTITADKSEWVHVPRNVSVYGLNMSDIILSIPGIEIHGKGKQVYLWDCFHQQEI